MNYKKSSIRSLITYLNCNGFVDLGVYKNKSAILNTHTKTIFFACFCFIIFSNTKAQNIIIGDSGDYPTLSAASAVIDPGDTILFQSQVFDYGVQFLVDKNGLPGMPIVLKAQNIHEAIFRGGSESIHLVNCSFIEIDGFIIEQQTANGMNIDDGGDYNTPAHHISIRNCIFRDMNANGNNDLLKMSGVEAFLIENCQFINGGSGGSGLDFVGCHNGIVQNCIFDNPGTSGIQSKGGTQYITIRGNIFKNIAQRALNLGGNTGLEFFRPPLSDPIVDAFEAADLKVFSNIFIGCWAPVAYVGCVRVNVSNNTFYQPENWVIRILQETTVNGFLTCADNIFANNIIYQSQDLTEINIGPNTDPASFIFSHNLWYNESNPNWQPVLPVLDNSEIIANPQFTDVTNENFLPQAGSLAVASASNIFGPGTDFFGNSFNDPPSRGALEVNPFILKPHIEIYDNRITIHPNPSTNNILLDGNFANAIIHVLDESGATIQDLSNINSPYTIDLTSLPADLYFVSIKSKLYNRLRLQKIIKY